jgi:hypothetical protein
MLTPCRSVFFDNQRRACERIETLKEPLNEAFLA